MNVLHFIIRFFQGRYRASKFVVGYITIFVLLALFGYYASGRGGLVEETISFLHQRFQSDMGYYPLPRMVVSMSSGGDGGGGQMAPRIRMEIVLEVAHKDMNVLSGYQPRIQEKINAYILRLKPEDIARKNAIMWLRGELLDQINSVGAPVPIHDLYFQQFVVM